MDTQKEKTRLALFKSNTRAVRHAMLSKGKPYLLLLCVGGFTFSFFREIDTLPKRQDELCLCGYDFKPLAEAVFPDYGIRTLNSNTCRSPSDVILVGMHGPCDTRLLQKPSKVVYVNGEAYAADALQNSFYLGPISSEISPTVKQMQFSYVQLAALELGKTSFRAFAQRPYHHKTSFLMYTSSRCLKHREAAFGMFASISSISAGGKCHGDASKYEEVTESGVHRGNPGWKSAHTLFTDYKFALVMENTKTPGYITEKILNAFIAGCVPIYYGTEDVFKVFNKDAFVYFDENFPEKALKQVKHMMTDAADYEWKRKQPILAEGALSKYFSLFYEQNGDVAIQIRKFLELQVY